LLGVEEQTLRSAQGGSFFPALGQAGLAVRRCTQENGGVMTDELNHELPGGVGETEGVEEREAGGESITGGQGKPLAQHRKARLERKRGARRKRLLNPTNP